MIITHGFWPVPAQVGCSQSHSKPCIWDVLEVGSCKAVRHAMQVVLQEGSSATNAVDMLPQRWADYIRGTDKPK